MKKIFALFAITVTTPLTAFSAVPAQQPSSSAVTAPTVNNSPQVAAISQVAPTPVADEASELAALQRRIPVLKAKAEIAKQEAEIAKAEAEKRNAISPTAQAMGGMQSPSLTAGLPTTVSVQTPQASRTPNPVKPTESINVNAITSFNGRFAASLDVNGSDVPVRPGDQIEGGWTVGTITASTVAISKKNQSRLLRW
jgi:type IV pilus biogenesis protein PilP